jgi:hypothetical protein
MGMETRMREMTPTLEELRREYDEAMREYMNEGHRLQEAAQQAWSRYVARRNAEREERERGKP